jgi:NAD(P)-dependent dehydrogenase (short-subunit alcohol dehydrogenase family)
VTARFVQVDMSDADSANSLVQQCGKVDIVVNNAGSFPSALTVEQSKATFETMFNTNVRGAYFLVAGLVPNAASRARQHRQHHHHGCVQGDSRGVRLQRLPSGPGIADPHLGRGVRRGRGAGQQRGPGATRTLGVAAEWGDTNEELGRSLPLGREAFASDIAEAVLFLSSPRSSFITGSTLHVDGGGAAI